MATFITRSKSGRVTSRRKFTPGTSSSPFSKKSRSSSRKPSSNVVTRAIETKKQFEKAKQTISEGIAARKRKQQEDARKKQEAKIFSKAPSSRSRGSSSSNRKKQTAAEISNFKVKITDPRTKKVTQQIDKQIESKSLRSSKSRSLQRKAEAEQQKKLQQAQQRVLKPSLTKPKLTPKPFRELDKTTQALLKGKSLPIQQGAIVQRKQAERESFIQSEQIRLLKNVPKDVILGIFEVGRDIVKSGVGAVTGSVDYGRNLVKRSIAAGGGKRPIDFLVEDVKKIGTTTSKVTSLIKNNPQKALIIVGAASSKIGKSLAKEFIKNPIKTTTKAILILSPKIVAKGIQASAKFLTKSKTLQSVLHAEKFSKNTFKVSNDLVKGISKVKGNIDGTFLNGQKFSSKYSLTMNSKTKKVTGQIATTVGKKTSVQNVNLIDKVGFYLDPKKNIKIPKLRAPIKSRSIKITETILKPIKGTSRSTVDAKGFIAQQTDADFITTLTRIIDNSKKVTTRTGQIRLLTSPQTARIKSLSEQFTKVSGKVKRTTQSKPLTSSEIKSLEKFIDDIGIANLSGLDRRSKVAQALGVTKTSSTLKGFENVFKTRFAKIKPIKLKRLSNIRKNILGKEKAFSRLKNKGSRNAIVLKSEIKVLKNKLVTLTEQRTEQLKRLGRIVDDKSVVVRKGKAVFKSEITTGKVPTKKVKFKVGFKTRKLSDLRKSKKGQVSLFKDDRIQILRKQGTKFKTSNVINIPALKSSVPLTIPTLKSIGVLTRATSLIGQVNLLQKNISLLSEKEFTKQVNKVIEKVAEIQRVIDKSGQTQTELQAQRVFEKQTQKPGQKQTQTTSTKTTRKTTQPSLKKTQLPKITPKPKPRVTLPPREIKIPDLPSLTFGSKLPKGVNLAFGMKYNERRNTSKPFNKKTNPVVVKVKKLNLPFNKAIKVGFDAIDNTTQRSAELFISGVTKAKDITKPTILKKFGTKKGKKTLKFVEKSKFAIDKIGEKRGLSVSKALKKKITKKTSTKKSVVTKKKVVKKTTSTKPKKKK